MKVRRYAKNGNSLVTKNVEVKHIIDNFYVGNYEENSFTYPIYVELNNVGYYVSRAPMSYVEEWAVEKIKKGLDSWLLWIKSIDGNRAEYYNKLDLEIISALGGDVEGAKKSTALYNQQQEEKRRVRLEREAKIEAAEKARKEAEQKEKAERRHNLYHGYLDDMSPMQVARVEKQLSKTYHFSGHGVIPCSELCESVVKESGACLVLERTYYTKNYIERKYYTVGGYEVPLTVYNYALYLAGHLENK